jgi:hypothetical protein
MRWDSGIWMTSSAGFLVNWTLDRTTGSSSGETIFHIPFTIHGASWTANRAVSVEPDCGQYGLTYDAVEAFRIEGFQAFDEK